MNRSFGVNTEFDRAWLRPELAGQPSRTSSDRYLI